MRWTPSPKMWPVAAVLGALLMVACPDAPTGPRFLGAGSPKPIAGGTLKIASSAKVRTLDPHIGYDAVSAIALELLYEGLLSYGTETQLIPSLATSLPIISEDGRVFTFEMRKGQRFHNGREVTAHDVAWSMERMLDPDLHSPAYPFFKLIAGLEAYRAGKEKHISGITVLDRYRVRFQLTTADQTFIHAMAMRFASPVPREAVEKWGDLEFSRHPCGAGPFRLASWDPGVRLVFEPYRRYGGREQTYLERIVLEEDLTDETAFLRLRNGEIDIQQSMTTPDRLFITRQDQWKPHRKTFPRTDVYGLVMNTRMEPFDNVHVRRAVAFALDRARWAKIRLGGLLPTGQVLPPAIPAYDRKLPTGQFFSLRRAREEMKLAGHAKGIKKPVTMWTTDSDTARQYGELTQSDLKKIGIEVRLKQVSFPVYLQQTGKPDTVQMATSGWLMDFPDPSNFLFLFQTSSIAPQNSNNRSFYSNPAFDALMRDALTERNHDKRMKMYREANALVSRDAPWAFFANSVETHVWQPYVHGYDPHPVYWIHVQNVWLDLPRRRIARAFLGPAGQRFADLSPFGGLL
jgi:oligopeptide transport system substrate-binding protein